MSEAIEYLYRLSQRPESGSKIEHTQNSWNGSLAAMTPFLVFGLAMILFEVLIDGRSPRFWHVGVGIFLLLTPNLVLAVGLAVGWIQDFPRWVFPYGGLAWGLLGYSYTYIGSPRWLLHGLMLWIPLLLALLVALLLTGPVRPVYRLVTGIWHDWTQLTFGVYGVMPWLIFLAFDEVGQSYLGPYMLLSVVALAGGAWGYMRSSDLWQRVVWLFVSTVLAWGTATIGVATFWHGRQEFWMVAPGNGYDTARRMMMSWSILLALMFLPALIGGLRWVVNSIRER